MAEVPLRLETPAAKSQSADCLQLVWAICTIARSGSSWLSQLVASTQVMGNPDEYLLDWRRQAVRQGFSDAVAFEEYVWWLLRQRATANGVFAVKGSVDELQPFFELFPNAPCVWLSREDKAAQAVSWHRAHDGGVWTRTGPSRGSSPFDASLERVLYFYDEIQRREAEWHAFFARRPVPPLALTYERMCLDPLATVHAIAAYLGIDPGGIRQVSSPLRIVRDATTAELTERAERAIRSRR